MKRDAMMLWITGSAHKAPHGWRRALNPRPNQKQTRPMKPRSQANGSRHIHASTAPVTTSSTTPK